MNISLESKFRTGEILDRRNEMIKNENLKSSSKMKYDKFLELYEKYGEGFEEKFFAYAFLDIEEARYVSSYIKKGSPTIVLSRQNVLSDSNHILDLRKKIIYDEGLHIGEVISYERICELYAKYGEGMTEADFIGEILDISARSLSRMKSSDKASTTIFGNVELPSEAEIKALRDRIAVLNRLEGGQILERSKIEEYHQKYAPEFLERYFVIEILDVKGENYNHFASGKNNAITILHNRVTNFEWLRKKVIKERKLHFDDMINYADFVELHQAYAPNMPEKVFAENILDITPSNFREIKYREGQARILLGCKLPTKRDIEELRKKIISDKKIRVMDPITLAELQNWHENYGGVMPLKMFAVDVLLMSEQVLRGLTSENGEEKVPTAYVLYNYEMPLEEIEAVKSSIRENENLSEPRMMSAGEIEELYATYGGIMAFNKFLTGILGVQRKNFENLKFKSYHTTMVCVRDGLSPEEIATLNKLLVIGTSEKEISEEMQIPISFLRSNIRALKETGDIVPEEYMYYQVGYMVVEQKRIKSEVACELGLSNEELASMVDRYKTEKLKKEAQMEADQKAQKKLERKQHKKEERKMRAVSAFVNDKLTPRGIKTIQLYIDECRRDFEDGSLKEEDLKFLGDCLSIVECGSSDIEWFSKVCINFNAYDLASEFISTNMRNDGVTRDEREKLIVLQRKINYSIKKAKALDMIIAGVKDTRYIADEVGILEVDVIGMRNRMAEGVSTRGGNKKGGRTLPTTDDGYDTI